MKCLVTGGAGFIGSHLCRKLLALGHEVICVDNLITGSEENIRSLAPNSKFKFIRHDVTKPLPDSFEAQVIFHLASPASPNKDNPLSYMHFPIETLLVNSYGTFLLLEKARKWGAKFLFASSSEVYGDPGVHPQKEEYWGNVNPVGVRSCYDEGKRFGEAIAITYLRKFDLDVRVARIFNTYGPRMPDDGRVIVSFIKNALTGKPIPVFGDGRQTRSFCFVDDLVDGLIAMFVKDEVKGKMINLGNPNEYNILELAELVKKQTGSVSKLIHSPLPEDDPVRRCPDIKRAREILLWEPEVTLDKGLEKTIEYFKTHENRRH